MASIDVYENLWFGLFFVIDFAQHGCGQLNGVIALKSAGARAAVKDQALGVSS